MIDKRRATSFLIGLAAIALILALLPPAARAATYYVSETLGSDTTGDGGQLNPYSSIGYALQQASDGDTVRVAEGTYLENLVIPHHNMTLLGGYEPGSWTRNLTVHRTIVDGGDSGSVFEVEAKLNVTIDGFVIQNGDWGVGISNLSADVTVSNNVIRDSMIGVSTLGMYVIGAITPAVTTMSHNLIINNDTGFTSSSVNTNTYDKLCMYYDPYGYC